MTALLLLTLLAAPQSAQVQTVTGDSIERVRRTARRAEGNFERLARRLAPIKLAGSDGRSCDEIVGRFCLHYDTGRLPEPDPEPGPVIDARRDAIEALRHAFSYMPGDFETAGPLIRYLVEDGRAAEAVPAARMFALVSADSVWGPLLLGFALHAAGEDSLATVEFELGLNRIEAREAERVRDLEWLLGAADRGKYDDLEPADRAAFEARLWTLADPLYLTPGNERLNAHIARHVWSRILARTPIVADMVRWGSDLEQLTVRYGIPTSRTRSPAWGLRDGGLTEHYDPDQLSYVPEALLTRGLPPTPLPGDHWELAETRSRSGYAPGTVSRLRPMDHQVSRFPTPAGTTIRIDAAFSPDSATDWAIGLRPATSVETGLFLLVDGAELRTEIRAWHRLVSSPLLFGFEAHVPQGEILYSIEALEDSTLRAGRARYAATIEPVEPGLMLSDPVVLEPIGGLSPPSSRTDPSFRPVASLQFAPFDTIGIYAEVHGLHDGSTFEVEVSIAKASKTSLPARLAGWLGDRLGLSSPTGPPRLRWTAAADTDGAARIAVDLALDGLDGGAHVIILEVRDPASGQAVESRRVLVIKS